MMNISIEGSTREVGRKQGYVPLRIKDYEFQPGIPAMVSAWEPTPAELEKLIAGAPVYLHILGTGWPPVLLEVGPMPAPVTET